MLSTRSLVLLPATLALLCATALASIATPPSGTPIDLKLGGAFSFKLKNAQGCTFDYTATVDDPTVAQLSRVSGTGVTSATIGLTGLKVGWTMVTLESMGGTCPPATHTYLVTVAPDEAQLVKSYATITKDAAADVKLGIKLGFTDYNNTLKSLGVEYKNGTLDNDELQDGFHDAADTLRRSVYNSGMSAYESVIAGGTMLIADNGLAFGGAPIGLFAGGCSSFDTFQDSVCSGFAKYHDTFDKASKKGVTTFLKAGGPLMGQWSVVPPLYAGGPVFPNQLGSILGPQPLLGPLTITTRPASGMGGNGRLCVSGMGDTALSGQLEVSLTYTLDGDAPWVTTVTPTITSNEWTTTFPDLDEGAYSLDTRYSGDSYGVTIPLHIGHQF